MKSKQRSVAYAAAFIVGLALLGFLTVGFAGILFSAAFLGGFVLWILTTYRTPVDPNKMIVAYLVTVVLFVVHVYEEYMSHIERTLTRISGLEVTQSDFLTVAAFSGPVVWLLGAVMMLNRWHFGYFFGSTFLFGMMFAEASHFINPFLEDGTFHYSAGMYTAILPIASAWFTFRIVLREMKNEKQAGIGSGPLQSRSEAL
jgi:hypothetical protein